MGESDKIRNSRSCKYHNGFILDVIKYPDGGTQEIPTPQTTSDPKHNPRGAPSSVPDRPAPVFEETSRDPSGSPSDKKIPLSSTNHQAIRWDK